jgi:hypothetical protein
VNRSLRSLVAVSSDVRRDALLEALLVDANDYDVVYMESLMSASARVRLALPDLVVVLLDVDNALKCHLTALLKIDCERLGIALVTCASRSPEEDFDDVAAMDRDILYGRVAISMN